MKQRTYRRTRYASPEYQKGAPTQAAILRGVRLARRDLLQVSTMKTDLRRALKGAEPGTRRMLMRFVRADLAAMHADGAVFELAGMLVFMSPYARRALGQRLRRRADLAVP
jgi:hypothetical protein